MRWLSEAEEMPKIGQIVLLAVPRQFGALWDLKTAQLLARHEGVVSRPVAPGSRWPTEFWWDAPRGGDVTLVTGNSWWALLDDIELPPGAQHAFENGFHYVAQPKPVFVEQKS